MPWAIVTGLDDDRPPSKMAVCIYREFRPTVRFLRLFVGPWIVRIVYPLKGLWPMRMEWET